MGAVATRTVAFGGAMGAEKTESAGVLNYARKRLVLSRVTAIRSRGGFGPDPLTKKARETRSRAGSPRKQPFRRLAERRGHVMTGCALTREHSRYSSALPPRTSRDCTGLAEPRPLTPSDCVFGQTRVSLTCSYLSSSRMTTTIILRENR